ncbi:alanine racemase [Phosphitispora sp. TUW77]|uniref:alanine racemase n=1 Tax=Phosphitispora sp. TUW77 TaxID=3152361 RepID=UPI003AB5B154
MEKWMEIDLDRLKDNVQALQTYFNVPIMAVIKQDAYGLGALTVGSFLEQLGIQFFAVTTVAEGVELRAGGIKAPILVFAPLYNDFEQLRQLWEYSLIPAVYSMEAAETINEYAVKINRSIDVHLKIDSGMGRMGFAPEEISALVYRLKKLDKLGYKGIFTHYSNAFEKEIDYTAIQKENFLNVVADLAEKGLVIPLKYSANSLAALKFPETHMDMVSIGSAFLGNSIVNPAVPLKRVYRFRAKVLQVRSLPKGSFIGYSNTYRTKRTTKVAVLPIGYTDGFGVQKKNDAFRIADYLREQYYLIKSFFRPDDMVFFEGKPLKVIGKTSLQLTVVDIGGLPVKPGDVVDISLNPLFAGARMGRVYVGAAAAEVDVSALHAREIYAGVREAAAAGQHQKQE